MGFGGLVVNSVIINIQVCIVFPLLVAAEIAVLRHAAFDHAALLLQREIRAYAGRASDGYGSGLPPALSQGGPHVVLINQAAVDPAEGRLPSGAAG